MRFVRGLVRALFLILVLMIGAGGAAVAASQTAWFREWLRGFIVAQSAQFLNGNLTIGRLSGNLFSGVALDDVEISMDGQPVISLQDVALRYNAWQLITRGISIDELRISRPHLFLREGTGGWQIARLIKRQAQEADRAGPASPFGVEQIVVVDGVVEIAGASAGQNIPQRLGGLSLVASFAYEPVRYSVNVESLSVGAEAPDLNVRMLSGGFAVKDDTIFIDKLSLRTDQTQLTVDGAVQQYLATPILNLHVSSPQLSVPEIARFVPTAAGIELQPSIDAKVEGAFNGLKIEASVASAAGSAKAALLADVAEPGQSVSGDLSVQHLDLAPLLRDPSKKSDITADVKVDLAGDSLANLQAVNGMLSGNARVAVAGYTADRVDLRANLSQGTASIDAKVFAYGAAASAVGSVSLPAGDAPIRFDLKGAAKRLNVRALPRSLGAPPVPTDINVTYHVVGTQPMGARSKTDASRLTADALVSRSTIPGLRIDDGGRVIVNVNGEDLAYRADVNVSDVDLQQIGRAFDVPALVDDRYRSVIAGHVVAEGKGTDVATLDIDANGTIASAELMGGRISDVEFKGGLHRDQATIEASGTFADFDPATLSGKPEAKGRIAGDFTANAMIADVSSGVTPDNISGDLRAALSPSVVGEVAIDRAAVNASYLEQIATVRELSVVGRDVNLTASGSLALGRTGESNLTFHADSPRLSEIGRIVGAPLAGIGRADGTITGNRAELKAAGTFEGDGLQYQENGALSLRTTFTASVPELTFAQSFIDARSHATFVTLAGQNINELEAKTTYDQSQVSFELTAKQPMRQLDAAGAVTLHPDHQEVHLDRLALQAAGQQWQVPDGERPTIQYGAKAIAVEQLRLVNGDQQITAEGSFGAPGETLKLHVTNMDLAAVDALLLRPPQFTGRLGATGEVSGTTDALQVQADFEVKAGGFRQFTYDSFGGHIDYTGKALSLDARLQQNASQWITAKGRVPTALFSGETSAEGTAASSDHEVSIAEDERVDVVVDSSPLGLGLVQGFTTAVTNVTGTVEAHLRVTGSARDPHPEGAITIADGALTVASTGVTYTNIAGKVELRPDKVHIDSLVALDNHQSAMSLTGDLAVHAREVGGVQLWLNAQDFKILDNKMGNVRVQTAVEIAGELRAPVIQGDFGVDTGRVDLDSLIALAAPSPYATTQIEYVTPNADAEANGGTNQTGARQATVRPSIFDALRMNLRIQIPDDLVVKASNLQAPGATVSLGALSVTLGGDLLATKAPRDSVRLTGHVNTVRGTYDFQGRRFEILRDGTVRFDGGETLTPILDLRTRREIQGVEALVTIRGTLDRPEVILSSTPPLEDADILSLIVFNQPINQLGEGQQTSLTARAQSLAVGAVAGQLSQSIGNALNLDTFAINLGPENGGAAELTFGQQLGKDLYVKVLQGVGDSSTTNVIIEYALARWLRLQTNVLQGSSAQQSVFRRQQGSGADLIVLFTK